MPRTVKPWVGKTDDARAPRSVQLRILERQQHKCAITGLPFDTKNKPEFDHKTPLWLGGKNCEDNLQAIRKDAHKRKTAAEATVRGKVKANAAKHVLPKEAPAKPIQSRGFTKAAKPPKQSRHDWAPDLPRRLYQ